MVLIDIVKEVVMWLFGSAPRGIKFVLIGISGTIIGMASGATVLIWIGAIIIAVGLAVRVYDMKSNRRKAATASAQTIPPAQDYDILAGNEDPLDYELVKQYAEAIGYSEGQIEQMSESQLAMLEHARTHQYSWWDGVRTSKFFEPYILVAYAVLVAFIWWQSKEPPIAMLIAGAVLLLANIVMRTIERHRGKQR